MALARFTRNCLSVVYHKTSCSVNKLPVQKAQRNFSLSKLRMDLSKKNMDQIPVDSLSKLALVVDGKYKTMKDVPAYLPYGTVYRARDKFRIKASMLSGLFLVILIIFAIRKNQNLKREDEYERMIAMEEADRTRK